MKNSKKCPKCSSSDIIIVDGYTGAYGSGNNIITGYSIFSGVGIDRYICCSCGFTEEWIAVDQIEKIRKSKKSHT
ncbi:MAG: hypothetical protein HFH30_11935 [Eubacterium sp.]|nr:hypothetical protein [Eubacterium sp.]